MFASKPLKTNRLLIAKPDLNYPTTGPKTSVRYNIIVGTPVSGIKPILQVSGGDPFRTGSKYKYKILGKNMIPGLTINESTGEISGTPLVRDIDQFGHVYSYMDSPDMIKSIRVLAYDSERHVARSSNTDNKYIAVDFHITWPKIKIIPPTYTKITKNLDETISFNIFVDSSNNPTVSGGAFIEQSYIDAHFRYEFDTAAMLAAFPSLSSSISSTRFGDLIIDTTTGNVTGRLGDAYFLNNLSGTIHFIITDKYNNTGKFTIDFEWILLPLVVTKIPGIIEAKLLADNVLYDTAVCYNVTGGLPPYNMYIDDALYSDFTLYNKSTAPRTYNMGIKSTSRTKYIDKLNNPYIPIVIKDFSTGGLNNGPQTEIINNIIISVHNKLLPIPSTITIECSAGDLISSYSPFNVPDKINNLYNGFPAFNYSRTGDIPFNIDPITGVVSQYTIAQSDVPSPGTPKTITYKLLDSASYYITCDYIYYVYATLSAVNQAFSIYPRKSGSALNIAAFTSVSGGVPITTTNPYIYNIVSSKSATLNDPTNIPSSISGLTDVSISTNGSSSTSQNYTLAAITSSAFTSVSTINVSGNIVNVKQFIVRVFDKLSNDPAWGSSHIKDSVTFQIHEYDEMKLNGLVTANIPTITYSFSEGDAITPTNYTFTGVTGGYGARTYSVSNAFSGIAISNTGNITTGATYSGQGLHNVAFACTDSLSNVVSKLYQINVYAALSVVNQSTLIYPRKTGSTLNINAFVSVSGGVPINVSNPYNYIIFSSKSATLNDPTNIPSIISGLVDASISGSTSQNYTVSSNVFSSLSTVNVSGNIVNVKQFVVRVLDNLSSDPLLGTNHIKDSISFQVHEYDEMKLGGLITANIPSISYYVNEGDTIVSSNYTFTGVTGGYGARTYSVSNAFSGIAISNTGNITTGATYSGQGLHNVAFTCTDSVGNSVSKLYQINVYAVMQLTLNTTGTVSHNGDTYYKVSAGSTLSYQPIIVTGGSGTKTFSFDSGGSLTSIVVGGSTFTIDSNGVVTCTSTPTTPGDYTITIYCTDPITHKVLSSTFKLWVKTPMTIAFNPNGARSSNVFSVIAGTNGGWDSISTYTVKQINPDGVTPTATSAYYDDAITVTGGSGSYTYSATIKKYNASSQLVTYSGPNPIVVSTVGGKCHLDIPVLSPTTQMDYALNTASYLTITVTDTVSGETASTSNVRVDQAFTNFYPITLGSGMVLSKSAPKVFTNISMAGGSGLLMYDVGYTDGIVSYGSNNQYTYASYTQGIVLRPEEMDPNHDYTATHSSPNFVPHSPPDYTSGLFTITTDISSRANNVKYTVTALPGAPLRDFAGTIHVYDYVTGSGYIAVSNSTITIGA